jgi:hypothetical protein
MKRFKEKKEKVQKPTKAEMNRRLEITEELIIKGLSAIQIREYLWVNRKVLLCKKSVERYVTRVNKELDAAKAPFREREIKKAIRRYELWMSKSDGIQDYRTAAKIQGQLDDLLGLKRPQKLDIDVKATVSMEDLRKSRENLKGEKEGK